MTADGRAVVVASAGDVNAPTLEVELETRCVGVSITPLHVLALDCAGCLYGIDPETGEVSWRTRLPYRVSALAARPDGRWAAIHASGIVWGEGRRIHGEHDAPGAIDAAFDPEGDEMAVLTADGALWFYRDADDLDPQVIGVGRRPDAVAYNETAGWLVSNETGLVAVPHYGRARMLMKWVGEGRPRKVVSSADGRLCAFWAADRAVCVFGVRPPVDCGAVMHALPQGASAGQLAFGPSASLGVALGAGRAHVIDLGRGKRTFQVSRDPDAPEVTVLDALRPDALARARGERAASALPPAPKAAAKPGPREDVLPQPGLMRYSAVFALAAGLLAASAAAGWFARPVVAWLVAGILAISALAIAVTVVGSESDAEAANA